jgi:hypothetical protein
VSTTLEERYGPTIRKDSPEYEAMETVCALTNALTGSSKASFLRYVIAWAEGALPYVTKPDRVYVDRLGWFRWGWEARSEGRHLDAGISRTKRGAYQAASSALNEKERPDPKAEAQAAVPRRQESKG